jgi:hypothetical protein
VVYVNTTVSACYGVDCPESVLGWGNRFPFFQKLSRPIVELNWPPPMGTGALLGEVKQPEISVHHAAPSSAVAGTEYSSL